MARVFNYGWHKEDYFTEVIFRRSGLCPTGGHLSLDPISISRLSSDLKIRKTSILD